MNEAGKKIGQQQRGSAFQGQAEKRLHEARPVLVSGVHRFVPEQRQDNDSQPEKTSPSAEAISRLAAVVVMMAQAMGVVMGGSRVLVAKRNM